MEGSSLHRFEQGGQRFVIDTETCFCFECDAVSWAVMDHYPQAPVNRILHLLGEAHPVKEVEEVIGELEWLRSTKSILPSLTPNDRLKQFDAPAEIREVSVRLPTDPGPSTGALLTGALALLLGRSGTQKDVLLRLYCASGTGISAGALATLLSRCCRDARLAAKTLSIDIVVELPESKPLSGHHAAAVLSLGETRDVETLLRGFFKAAGGKLNVLSAVADGAPGASMGVVLTPGNADFSESISYLNAQGFKRIDLDLPAAYAQHSGLDPAAILVGLQTSAVYYAQQLLKGNYFRLEPIASSFRQIYEGIAQPRSDSSGSNQLAIDEHGDIYPSHYFFGNPAFRLGNLESGQVDEIARGTFDDLGALTTPSCMRCWARNLCGGGHSAIHFALSGNIRTPNETWCSAQRDWYAAAVAAFNLLSAQGVNFARLYQSLQPRKKRSLWQAARTALAMKVGVRPIEEGDAELLTRWENWSGAAYFLGNEYGMFLATRYDREMDSLHPRGIEQELVIVSRRNEPLGLLKLRPDQRAGLTRVWFFLADPSGYADSGLRKSFRHILAEAAGQTPFTNVLASAGPGDPGLGDFLLALGFEQAGTERDALFVHDEYHDVALYSLRL